MRQVKGNREPITYQLHLLGKNSSYPVFHQLPGHTSEISQIPAQELRSCRESNRGNAKIHGGHADSLLLEPCKPLLSVLVKRKDINRTIVLQHELQFRVSAQNARRLTGLVQIGHPTL